MAEDISSLQQLCYRIVTLKYGLTPEEIKDLIKREDTEYPPAFIIPHELAETRPIDILPHWRVDPRVIIAYLIGTEIPTFYINDREYPLVSKCYGTYYRCWVQEINLNNNRLGRQYPGLQSGLHHWRDGFLRTYFYFDDLLLLNEYYLDSPREPVGTSWHLHKTPPTIYATAKAILQLCPYMPTTPLSDFRNLNDEQQSSYIPGDRGQHLLFPTELERKDHTYCA